MKLVLSDRVRRQSSDSRHREDNLKPDKRSRGSGDNEESGSSGRVPQRRKGPTVQHNLPCTLEQLYEGALRKMKITTTITDARGNAKEKVEIVTVNVPAGCKKGTKIVLEGMGDEEPNVAPGDIVFIVEETPHQVFRRAGNHIIATLNVSLEEALIGYTAELKTLDGRNLSIPIDDVIHCNYEKLVPGEGMPPSRDPSQKGNLRIKFNVNYPTVLSKAQKSAISKALRS